MRLRLGAVGRRMLRHVRLSVWSLAFASLPVLAAMVWPTGVEASVTCTALCAVGLATAVLGGLLVATHVAALIHRPAAAGLALALAACSFWYQDAALRPPWTGLAGIGFGIVGLLVANRPDYARAFAPPEIVAVPPRPLHLPTVRPRWWALALVATAVAAVPLWFAMMLAVDIGGRAELDRVPQLSLLLAVGTAMLGVAVAVIARAAGDARALRRLLRNPQPMRSMKLVVEESDKVAVFDGPDRVLIPVEPAERPSSVGRARIYGDPVAGGWFVSEVDGRVRAPTGPARSLPRDYVHRLTEVEERDPDWSEEPGQVPDHLLVGADRAPMPATPRSHRNLAGTAGWFPLGAILLAPAPAVRAVLYVPWWVVAGVVTTAVAALLEAGWRRGAVGQRVDWNDGGVVITDGGRPQRQLTWSAVTGVSRFGPFVLVEADDDSWLTRGHQWFGRDRDELWAALTDTWRRANAHGSSVAPPHIEPPHRPLALFAVWLTVSALLTSVGLLALALQP